MLVLSSCVGKVFFQYSLSIILHPYRDTQPACTTSVLQEPVMEFIFRQLRPLESQSSLCSRSSSDLVLSNLQLCFRDEPY